ncbi:hypothetical protein N7516_004749, partial [Penicillium verrucosum]|uniref:uncharacterized protein n=1 Tax=Penicillium verrucosum TaxID=60171 RepID=UPI002544F48C
RRKSNLIKKAREYSRLYKADVYVGIRLRETGQASYYPTPFLIMDQDLEKAEEGIIRKPSEANLLA